MRIGANISGTFLDAARLRASGCFALLAILLHVVIPTAYDLASPATLGLMQATICAGGVSKTVLIDKDGKPVQHSPAQKHDCNACASHCAALLVATVTAVAPHWGPYFSALFAADLVSDLSDAGVQPRGPPA